ncbi:MAG: hypothetical protein M1819_004447 [Sarea resinae]|nr:MAG: hypothetical protein M1819_004447 [Sarea resinae]
MANSSWTQQFSAGVYSNERDDDESSEYSFCRTPSSDSSSGGGLLLVDMASPSTGSSGPALNKTENQHIYGIDQLLELGKDIGKFDINVSKFLPAAFKEQVIKPTTKAAQATNPSDLDQYGLTQEDQALFRRVSNGTESGSKPQEDPKFEEFKKRVASPPDQRVTAGGRIVPAGSQPPIQAARLSFNGGEPPANLVPVPIGGFPIVGPAPPFVSAPIQAVPNGSIVNFGGQNYVLYQGMPGVIPGPPMPPPPPPPPMGFMPYPAPFGMQTTPMGPRPVMISDPEYGMIRIHEESQKKQKDALQREYQHIQDQLKDMDKHLARYREQLSGEEQWRLTSQRRQLITNQDQIRLALNGLNPVSTSGNQNAGQRASSSEKPRQFQPVRQFSQPLVVHSSIQNENVNYWNGAAVLNGPGPALQQAAAPGAVLLPPPTTKPRVVYQAIERACESKEELEEACRQSRENTWVYGTSEYDPDDLRFFYQQGTAPLPCDKLWAAYHQDATSLPKDLFGKLIQEVYVVACDEDGTPRLPAGCKAYLTQEVPSDSSESAKTDPPKTVWCVRFPDNSKVEVLSGFDTWNICGINPRCFRATSAARELAKQTREAYFSRITAAAEAEKKARLEREAQAVEFYKAAFGDEDLSSESQHPLSNASNHGQKNTGQTPKSTTLDPTTPEWQISGSTSNFAQNAAANKHNSFHNGALYQKPNGGTTGSTSSSATMRNEDDNAASGAAGQMSSNTMSNISGAKNFHNQEAQRGFLQAMLKDPRYSANAVKQDSLPRVVCQPRSGMEPKVRDFAIQPHDGKLQASNQSSCSNEQYPGHGQEHASPILNKAGYSIAGLPTQAAGYFSSFNFNGVPGGPFAQARRLTINNEASVKCGNTSSSAGERHVPVPMTLPATTYAVQAPQIQDQNQGQGQN